MSGLPSGYTQLEYIQSTGTQYINTDVDVNAQTYDKLEISADVLYPSLSSAYYMVHGCSGSGVIYYFGINNSNGAVVYGPGTSDQTTALRAAANTRYSIVFSVAEKYYQFGSNAAVSITPAAPSGNSKFYLFAYNKGASHDCHAERLYSAQIKSDGTLVRDFVPCKNVSGAVGLYDTVKGQFYANAGTGTFTAGPEIIPDPPAAPTGLQTVLAVVLQWAASANADRYDVYRDGAKLGSTETTQYVDTTPEANQTYVYTVKAVNGGGESAGTSITVYTKSGYFEYKPLIESANFP